LVEASTSVNIPRLVSIHAALDCLHDRDRAALTAPFSRRRYDHSTLKRLRDDIIAIGARCRGQVDWRSPDWIELIDYHFEYRDFLGSEGIIPVLVAVSNASYLAAEIKDRSAPKPWLGAIDTRYCLVARNLVIETTPLLRLAHIAATTSAPPSDGVTDASSAETARELVEAPTDGVIIREVIRAVYDEAERTSAKPPNINELPGKVQSKLKDLGYRAAGRRIKTIGEDPEFKRRRRVPGRRWRGNR
jgi:hypothetical protein